MTSDAEVGDRMREVNDAMWASLMKGGYEKPIAFFCECSDPACYQAVWLTSVEYARACADPDWQPLLDGHPSAAVEAHGSW